MLEGRFSVDPYERGMHVREIAGKARGIWLFAAENTVVTGLGKSVGFRR